MTYQDQGFTLVELLITVALLAILANIAIPAFEGLVNRNRQQALLEQAESILNNARADAVLKRRTVEICGSSDGQTCSANWASGWLVQTLDDQVLQITQLTDQNDLRWEGFKRSIRFRDNGSSPTGNGRFYQCDDEKVAWQLILNRQGRLRRGTPSENTAKADLCQL